MESVEFQVRSRGIPATMNAASLPDEHVDVSIVRKQGEGSAPATINRMLQPVGQAYGCSNTLPKT